MSTATAATYQGTFGGRAGEAARVRREITRLPARLPGHRGHRAHRQRTGRQRHRALSRSRGGSFAVRCQVSPGAARVEVEDMGGPWRPRKPDDRPHGLDIVQALTGDGGWGTQATGTGGRLTWARLSW